MLSEHIIQHIRANGPLSFHDFMETALYHPAEGYYTAFGSKIGPHGDYYTSCTLTPLYGATIARQIEEMWQYSGETDFTIVEFGAGTGALCADILAYFSRKPGLYNRLSYCIVEKSQAMRRMEKETLPGKVQWYNSVEELPQITGCIISNELVDNFAVHRVVMKDKLMEVFVCHEADFAEILQPAGDALCGYFEELKVLLPRGYQAEVNIEATEWIQKLAGKLNKGYILTIDYGYPSRELYSHARRDGTIMCYKRHKVSSNPYADIGMQDITAYVNFSSLYHWGQKHGLACCGYTNQASFLLAHGIREQLMHELLAHCGDPVAGYRKYNFILHNLLFDMGSKFKVLIQQKGLEQQPLKGLSLALPNYHEALMAA